MSCTSLSARTPGKVFETPDSDRTGVLGFRVVMGVAEGTGVAPDVSEANEGAPQLAKERGAGCQKILANFSTFDLSNVNGSAIAAEPSSPILMSPIRPAWIVVPGLPVALPEAMSAAIIVAE